jgi:hypothetical protein
MRLIGLEIPRNQTKALRLRSSVDHTVNQQQEKSPRLHREKCVFACPRGAIRPPDFASHRWLALARKVKRVEEMLFCFVW